MVKRLQQAKGSKTGLANSLIRDFDIDIIQNDHLLVQNTNILEVADPVKNFLDAKMRGIEDLVRSGKFTLTDYAAYRQYRVYGVAVSNKFDVNLIEKATKSAVKNTIAQIKSGSDATSEALHHLLNYLRGTENWPKEAWDIISIMLKSGGGLQDTAASLIAWQKKWPATFWKKVPSMIQDAGSPRLRSIMIQYLPDPATWPAPVHKALIAGLADSSPKYVSEVLDALNRADELPPEVWKRAGSFLRSADADVAQTMTSTLRWRKTWDKGFSAEVPSLLRNSPADVQERLITALNGQSHWAPEVWDQIPRLLQSDSPELAKTVAMILENRQQWPKPVNDFVVNLLSHAKPETRISALKLLASRPRWPSEVWSRLPALLNDSNRLVSREALFTSMKRRSLPPEIWDAIVQRMMANGSAFDFLMQLDGPRKLPPQMWDAIARGLKSPDKSLRLDFALMLVGEEKLPQEIWNALPELLKTETDSNVQRALFKAIESQPNWPPAIWETIPELARVDDYGQQIAVSALLESRMDALPATPVYAKVREKLEVGKVLDAGDFGLTPIAKLAPLPGAHCKPDFGAILKGLMIPGVE